MNPLDLLPQDEWARLERELTQQTGLTAVVFDPTNARVTTATTWANDLCPLIKGEPQSATQICAMAQQAIVAVARTTGTAVVDECDAGMVKIVAPIIVDGELVGSVSGCGRVLEGTQLEEEYAAESVGAPVEDVHSRVASVRTISVEEAQAHARLMQERVDAIVRRHGEP